MYTEKLKMSKWREAIFPIENRELKKFLLFALIVFITAYNYTQFRNVNDTLMLTVPESGAEALSYLKTMVVMPAAIFLSSLYFYNRGLRSFCKLVRMCTLRMKISEEREAF